MICVGTTAVLVVAALLVPDMRGMGTHEQLGLDACGFVRWAGMPCPSCGMTTAFAHAVRGHWVAAFIAQPMGFLMAVLTGIIAIGSAAAVVQGRTWTINWYRLHPSRVAIGLMVGFAAGWAYKILRYWQN
jgi:hypothetical protein